MPIRRHKLVTKRVYVDSSREDGARVLVDRVWPRGLTKQRAAVDLWLKEVAPSDALRKWFGHQPSRWKGFQTRYRAELDDNDEAVSRLRELHRKGALTLLYGARDESHNNAVALLDYLHAGRRGG